MSFRNRGLWSLTTAVVATAMVGVVAPRQASAYPIDCAILLCLAGGWPSSPECSAARATFIRRVTPWPIEPPLQIWRCPLGVAYHAESDRSVQRLHGATFQGPALLSFPTLELPVVSAVSKVDDHQPNPAAILQPVAGDISDANGTADVDISDPVFDFVRSIKVWDVRRYSHRAVGRNDECYEYHEINLGTYGTQGDFKWRRTGPAIAPPFVLPSRACDQNSGRRGVGVEWTDYEGTHGFEWISY